MTSHKTQYSGADVNTILATIDRLSQNGDQQLSILAHALVIACKSTQVSREALFREIDKLWDRDDPLSPLPKTQ